LVGVDSLLPLNQSLFHSIDYGEVFHSQGLLVSFIGLGRAVGAAAKMLAHKP
jgi:hypothetical protein